MLAVIIFTAEAVVKMKAFGMPVATGDWARAGRRMRRSSVDLGHLRSEKEHRESIVARPGRAGQAPLLLLCSNSAWVRPGPARPQSRVVIAYVFGGEAPQLTKIYSPTLARYNTT